LGRDRLHGGKVPGIDVFQSQLFSAPFRQIHDPRQYYHRSCCFSPEGVCRRLSVDFKLDKITVKKYSLSTFNHLKRGQ
jgi:hypothetical protein